MSFNIEQKKKKINNTAGELEKKAKCLITDFRIDVRSRFSNKAWRTMAVGGLCLVLAFLVTSTMALESPEKGLFRPNEEQLQAEEAVAARVAAMETEKAAEEAALMEPATAIVIQGEEAVALLNAEDAQAVIDAVVAHYQTAATGSEILETSYAETVEIAESSTPIKDALTVEEAVNTILTGTKEPKIYTVASGDNMWDVAIRNGMTVEELIAANPAIDPERLQIGQTLNLFECNPYIHVRIKERVTATETIAYSITYQSTDVLWKGETQVQSPGVNGSRDAVYEVISENGVQVSKTLLSSNVTSEPVAQVTLQGTKPLSILVGSGSFSNPMNSMKLSSGFGSRGGGRHYGADFWNPKGTPIYVVDSGTVTYAAYSGSFGNIVKVAHGNGYETWYAHCDTMLVSVGKQVSKGQQIATVGRTGRTTGYHLHFEVRLNGVAQNPLNYLP